MSLTDPEHALRLVLERVQPVGAETVSLPEAAGRVLATDVTSEDDVPPFDNSAMDGFAVRSVDTRGAQPAEPITLRVVDESRAGSPAQVEVRTAQAVRISTGAPLPRGADAIVRVEDTEEGDADVRVQVEVPPGRDVRRAGDDVRAGDVVLRRGQLLGPAEVGVLASVGVAEIPCSRRPVVTVLTTGDELAGASEPLGPGKIRNANAYTVPAQAREAGADVVSVETVPDDFDRTVEAIRDGLSADILVVCGGVSVGRHDHVKQALAHLGVEQVFWGVALRPGKPTWFGVHDSGSPHRADGKRVLVFGLPGNPVSAMITFRLFVRPALAAMLGESLAERRATAVMDERYPKQPGRAHVVRCRLELRDGGWHVRPTKDQGSHVLTSMLGAEALAFLGVERGAVDPGDLVEIEPLAPV